MRTSLMAVVFVALAGVAGALAYSAWANELEFDRQMAAGDQAVAAGRHFQAIEAFSGAVARKPDSMVAYFKRGSVYLDQGELDAALRDLRRATQIDPSALRPLESTQIDPSALRPLELVGDVNVQLGRADRAAKAYEAYIAQDEQSARVFYKLGLARYRAGRPAAAVDALRQSLALDPALGEAYYVLGLVERDQREFPAARASLEQSVRLSPASQTASREALAEVYGLEGDFTKSINQLEALAALEPSRGDRLVALGLAQARAGRADAAVTTLSRAVERFPEAPQAYAALGHVWLMTAQTRGDRVALNKAVEALQQAAGRSDATSDTFAELGRAWLLAGDSKAAERALRQAVARLPVPPDAFLQLANVTARDGRIQDARDALVKYATLVGDAQPLADVATRIADFSVRLGEPALAVRWFDRAVDEAGPSPVLLARLAAAAWAAGDISRARQVVDEGLSVEPKHPELLQLKRRLPPL